MFNLPTSINTLEGKTISSIKVLDGLENALLITFTDGSLVSVLQTGEKPEAIVSIWRKRN